MVELSPEEVRVLGALVEKHLATPNNYPLSLSSLQSACNQKTSREPVMDLGERAILTALDKLARKELAGTQTGASSRVEKYRYNRAGLLDLPRSQRATLALLMLRGPQTAGEIRSRSGRMHSFETKEDAQAALDALARHDPPLVLELPRLAGQKEARTMHLLAGEPNLEKLEAEAASPSGGAAAGGDLAEEVAALRDELNELREAFDRFRSQFE
jgi:uncharacterized protein YceH (UPF0502 family)